MDGISNSSRGYFRANLKEAAYNRPLFFGAHFVENRGQRSVEIAQPALDPTPERGDRNSRPDGQQEAQYRDIVQTNAVDGAGSIKRHLTIIRFR